MQSEADAGAGTHAGNDAGTPVETAERSPWQRVQNARHAKRPVDAVAQMFAHAGASHISFHPEATLHVARSLQAIRDDPAVDDVEGPDDAISRAGMYLADLNRLVTAADPDGGDAGRQHLLGRSVG